MSGKNLTPVSHSNIPADQVLTNRQTSFLQRLKDARDGLLKAIAGLDESIVTTERVIGDWTVKDLLGHVVSWNDEFRADIDDILRGEHPGYLRRIDARGEFNQWNQLQVSQKRSWSWSQVVDDLERDYGEACWLIQRLQPQDFRRRGVPPWKPAAADKPQSATRENTDSVETLLTYHWRHMNEHTRIIERWRKRRQQEEPSA
jgi:uncharacterized damage-inducible protein DinB